MAMNFFDHQENARRSSRRLVIMFAVAVVALISAFYFFFAFIGIWLEAPGLWQPRTLLWVAGSTILLGGLACWHQRACRLVRFACRRRCLLYARGLPTSPRTAPS